MIKEYLEIGQIVGTHGVRGELRVQPWCDSPDFFKKFKTLYFDAHGERPVGVVSARAHGNIVLLCLQDCGSVESAAALRGRVLFMRRSDAKLKEGAYFIAELIGCRVIDADNDDICYGTLNDVSQTGANDVWHITDGNGREHLIPAIPDVVKTVDVETGVVTISPLKGLFDDED